MLLPKTKKEIKAFLSRLQYISRFIAQLTPICELIFKLLRKKTSPLFFRKDRQKEALCFTWARKRWVASGMNHSFRVNPLVEGFVIKKVVVVGSVQFEIWAHWLFPTLQLPFRHHSWVIFYFFTRWSRTTSVFRRTTLLTSDQATNMSR